MCWGSVACSGLVDNRKRLPPSSALSAVATTMLPPALIVLRVALPGAMETACGQQAAPALFLSAVETTMLPPALSVLRDTAQLGAMMTVCGKVESASMLLVNTRMNMEA